MNLFSRPRSIRQQWPQGPADLHPLPDSGAGEGVPLQPLPDPQAPDRDLPRPVSDGETDQNLVSEPQDEVEKGEQTPQSVEDAGGGGGTGGEKELGGHLNREARVCVHAPKIK